MSPSWLLWQQHSAAGLNLTPLSRCQLFNCVGGRANEMVTRGEPVERGAWAPAPSPQAPPSCSWPPPEAKAPGAQGTAPPPHRFPGAHGAGWLVQQQKGPGARRTDTYHSAQGRQQGCTVPLGPLGLPGFARSGGACGAGTQLGLLSPAGLCFAVRELLQSGRKEAAATVPSRAVRLPGPCGFLANHRTASCGLGTPSSWWLRRLWHPPVLCSPDHSRLPLLSPFQGLTP